MRLAAGIVIGATVALIVYAVGTAITHLANEGLIWGLIAVVVWVAVGYAIYARWNPPRV